MRHASTGCFLIGVTGPGVTTSGEALLGSVSDDPYDIRTFVRAVRGEGALSHVGTELVSTTEHTLVDRGYFAGPGETTRGVNEAGLAFTCAMVFEAETTAASGGASAFAGHTRDLMTRCETVADAIGLFEEAVTTSPPFSVLLADANGDLAHLEVGSHGINVNHHYSKQHPGAVFAVNCYLSHRLLRHNAENAVIEDGRNNNRARRERGTGLAKEAQGRLDVAALASILSDHENRERDPMENPLLEAWGYSICNHGTRRRETSPHEDLPWGTVSAEILQPSARVLWYAYGWPCGQAPEHGDQIHQEDSWGRFVPFGLEEIAAGEAGETLLAAADGRITPAGVRAQAGVPGVAARRRARSQSRARETG